jgi:transcription elongation GreA/GreB family factor
MNSYSYDKEQAKTKAAEVGATIDEINKLAKQLANASLCSQEIFRKVLAAGITMTYRYNYVNGAPANEFTIQGCD